MVHNKLIILISFASFLFISFGCNSNKKADSERQILKTEECLNVLKSYISSDTISFCSNEIISNNTHNIYYQFKDIDCLESYLKDNDATLKYHKEISEFLDYSDNCSAYICEEKGKKYLIIIGKAIGASGIGHLYWNYMYTDLEKDINYRSSLVKNPFSFQIMDNKVHFIEINDNFSIEEYEENETIDLMILKYLNDEIKSKENFVCKK